MNFFSFNFIPFQLFHQLDSIPIILILIFLFEIIYKIRIFLISLSFNFFICQFRSIFF
jgi:hypothetical protein